MSFVEDGDDSSTAADDLVTRNGRHGKAVGRGRGVGRCDVEGEGVGGVAVEDELGKASRKVFGDVTYIMGAAIKLVVDDSGATIGVGTRNFGEEV